MPPLPHSTTDPAPLGQKPATLCIPPPAPAASGPPTPTRSAPDDLHPALAADLVFATFWVAPGIAPEDYQSRRPDLRFGAAIRQAHPGKRVHVAVLTDGETIVLDDGESAAAGGEVEVFRCAAIDRTRVGRNSYANYAQMVAQRAYLEHLDALVAASGGSVPAHPPVVFCDTDMLFVGDVSEVFERLPPGVRQTVADASLVPPPPALGGTGGGGAPAAAATTPYDYGLTISDSVDMPVNFGIQFVPAGGGARARAFLDAVCAVYDFSKTFVAGQEAIAEYCGVMDRAAVNAAVRGVAYGPAGRCLKGVGGTDGHGSGAAPGASFTVAFFPCLRWNACNCGQSCCTDPARGSAHIPKTAAELAAAKVCVYHFVGHRKPGFCVALAAFARGGAAAAYEAIAALPDEEEDYVREFGADSVAGGRAAATEAAVERALAAVAASRAGVLAAGVDSAAAAALLEGNKAACLGGVKACPAPPPSDDAALAPGTAPASRDPSPPRKRAVV